MEYALKSSMNVMLFEEYKKRHPGGAADKIKLGDLLKNELKFLRKIYLLEPARRSILQARSKGAGNKDLAAFLKLEKQIAMFESLSASAPDKCDRFLVKYQSSAKADIVRQAISQRRTMTTAAAATRLKSAS